METQGEDGNFLSEILLTGEDGTVAGLDDMSFGLTQETHTQEEVEPSQITKGTKRTKNFHWQDDEIICTGWLNISKDPIHGANQSRTSFWAKVKVFFDKHKKTPYERSVSSIMHRWLTIQWSVNRFCACYDAILRRNQSGFTIDDKINEAKLYVEWDKDNKTFGLLHCWKILKEEDKWKAKMIQIAEIEKEKKASNKKQKNSRKVSRPREEEEINNDQIEEHEEQEPAPRKRPDGIKKVKESFRRGGAEACMEVLDKMIAKREVLDKEKEKAKEERFMASLEVDKAALEIEKKRLATEEKKSRSKTTQRGKGNHVSRHVFPQPNAA